MIHNMVGGGGQSDGPVEAGTIIVSYPARATCTVTGNGQTYTALNTSGAAVFVVEPGTWTVNVEQAGISNSETVSITAEGQIVKVSIPLRTYLYKAGNTYDEITGGWINEGKKSNASSSIPAGTAQITYNADNISVSNGAVASVFYCQNKIDLTPYSTIVFKGDITSGSTSSNTYSFITLAIWSEIGTYAAENMVASISDRNEHESGELRLDISQLEGLYTAGFRFFQNGSAVIREVYLE